MNDLKFALRSLAKNPLFVVIAIVTLGLGIGLNTAMFSLANAMYLRPLPFDRPDELVRVFRTTPDNPQGDLSAGDFTDLQAGAQAFGDFAASADESVSLAEPGQPAQLEYAARVSANYFDLLRIHPSVGRTFSRAEEQPGHPVALISDDLWRRRFGADPGIVGRSVRIDGAPSQIVGVLPASADDGRVVRHCGLFRPFAYSALERQGRQGPWVRVIGRRAPTLTAAPGNAVVAGVGRKLAHDFPKDDGDASLRCADLLGSTSNDGGKTVTLMLLGLTAFVLLIACSNLANIILARTIERATELTVRRALGASRLALIRPLGWESLLLAAAGGAASMLVALAGTRWLSEQSVANGGSPMQFPLDWRVYGFAVGTSLATALLFGSAPALLIGRLSQRAHTRGPGGGRTHQRVRRVLVVGQFAMAMTLLAGAVFLGRGAQSLLRHRLGWDASQVVGGSFELPKSRFDSPEKIRAFERALVGRLQGLPGVQRAALGYALPYTGEMGTRAYRVEGRPRPAKGQETTASFNGITPDFFRVTGTAVLNGRSFAEADGPAAPKVVMINQAMAQALFPGESPIGRRLAQADSDHPEWAQIVGVVADIRPTGIYQRPMGFQVYHPLAQEPWEFSRFALRTAPGAEAGVLKAIGPAFATLDLDLPAREVMPADDMVTRASFDLGMLMKMVGTFAGLGLLMSAIGIYGVVARTVAQRTPEIGIRMALGATAGNVVRLILGSGIRLALTGAVIGLAGALGATRLLSSMMPAVESSAALVIAVASLLLTGVAVVASYLPARAAARVDPLCAIRSE